MPVIDATVAGASANSYLTVGEADALAAADLGRFADRWRAETPVDRKERALIRASREISARFGPTVRFSSSQALAFPRALDYVGTPPAHTPVLHASLLRACYEQAIYLNAMAEVLDDAAARRAQGNFTQTDDNGSWSISVDPQTGRIAPEALAALDELRSVATVGRPTIHSVRMTSSSAPE